MDIITLAFLLLIGRLVSIGFIVSVLRKQRKLRKAPAHPRIKRIRRILFTLAIVIFIFNLYPLILDVLTLFINTGRQPIVKVTGAAYALDANIASMLSSILIWSLYRLSSAVIELEDLVRGENGTQI